jgi:hypothetical protein
MFKQKILLKCIIIALTTNLGLTFMDISPTNDFETVAFDESIFRAYNSATFTQKEVKTQPEEPQMDSGIEATSGVRDVRVLRSPNLLKKKRKTSLEKLLNVALSGNKREDARKLVLQKCSNSIIRSYLHLDEEYPSNAHPAVADYEMVHVCENNKTTCCNKQETFELKKIFEEKQNKIRTLLKTFQKIVNKLGKGSFLILIQSRYKRGLYGTFGGFFQTASQIGANWRDNLLQIIPGDSAG